MLTCKLCEPSVTPVGVKATSFGYKVQCFHTAIDTQVCLVCKKSTWTDELCLCAAEDVLQQLFS